MTAHIQPSVVARALAAGGVAINKKYSFRQTEVMIERQLARAERLRQSILKRAFEGKLVSQDPNDELAGALLERIRSQRAG